MAVALLWVGFFTPFVEQIGVINRATPTPGDVLIFHAVFIAFSAVMVGYASVGALLAGRVGAGRIAALLLAGGVLFGLIPFGYVIGLTMTMRDPASALASAILLLGPVAIGPGFATILPGLAIAFPDGHLPSARWRWPVGIAVGVIAVGTFLNLIRPGPVAGGPPGRASIRWASKRCQRASGTSPTLSSTQASLPSRRSVSPRSLFGIGVAAL